MNTVVPEEKVNGGKGQPVKPGAPDDSVVKDDLVDSVVRDNLVVADVADAAEMEGHDPIF